MGKKNSILIFLFGLLFFMPVSLSAQETDEESLVKIIVRLQKQHKIQFNYAEDVIQDIFIIPPVKEGSLIYTLDYLEKSTSLSFILTDSNFVIVKPKEGLVLCGYLKDKDNLQPLSSATIQGVKNSTMSDENGFFQLKINSEYEQIMIRHLGYKTINRVFNHFTVNDCKPIYLRPDFQSLSEVLISNYITAGINKLNNGSFEIDFDNFDILPGLIENDVLQSIQVFPGIQSINETVSNINIRGGTHDQNLILWDDIKMYQSGHFFGLISMYNPQITQKVSLLKNGSDVSYTDGVSGTINMRTSKRINTKFKGNIGVNLTDFNAFVDAPIGKKSSIQVAARKSISDFLETPTYNEYFNRISQDTEVENNTENITNSDKTFDFYDTSMRWIYKISDRDEIRLNFIAVSNELLFDESTIINNDERSRESSLTQNSIAGAINYNRIWNENFQTTFEAYETDYKLKAINANVLEAQRFLQENVVSETSLKLKGNYILNERLALLGGYHFVETKVTNLDDVDLPLFRLLISEVVRTHGAFSQLNYTSLNRNTNLNIGVRYNYIDKFKKQIFEPRLSFSQRFLDHFTLEVLGEFKHQNTSQIINFQNDFLGIEKRRWQLSDNKDIPVITSKQVSAGINFSNSGWLVSAEGYYKKVDGITSQSQGFQNQYEFDRSNGSYEVTGLDVLFRKNIDHFNSWLSYSFMNNLYSFIDYEEYSFPSNFDITHAVTIGASYSNKNLKLSTGLSWHTGKPETPPIEGNEIVDDAINYDETNIANLNEYMRLDISAMYEFKIGRKTNANVGVSVWNVLDKENQINSFYQIDNGVVNEKIQRSLGITPNAVLRVNF